MTEPTSERGHAAAGDAPPATGDGASGPATGEPGAARRSLAGRLADLGSRVGSGAIRWTLLAILALAAIIGLLFVTRGTAVQHVRAIGADSAAVAPSEPAFPLSVALLTGTAIVPGNRVELAFDGDGTFPRLWQDLRSARRGITVQMYYAAPGRVADTLAAILGERARSGVATLAP